MNNKYLFEQANSYRSIESIVTELLPSGKKRGHEYVALNPTRNDRKLGSFSINIYTGRWSDFATGDKGSDITSLYAYVHGISQYEAAKAILGEDITEYQHIKTSKITDNNNDDFIKNLWNSCCSVNDSPVQNYLKGRAIICNSPSSIRYHPHLYHKESQTYLPVMVACVTVYPSVEEVIALHRTYLDPHNFSKADVIPNKKMLGHIQGGAVKFGIITDTLILAEGIETALSIYQETQIPTWAILASSNMQNVKLPPPNITIIIAADNDDSGLESAHNLAERLLTTDYTVRIALPPQKGSDFNNILMGN